MNNTEIIDAILPVGRIVRGNPSVLQTMYQGKPKEHPNYYFGVAVPKADALPVVRELVAMAQRGYQNVPAVLNEIAKGFAGTFACKFEDGDSPENQGKEGHAGCFIFNFSTTRPFACFNPDFTPVNVENVKCGYFVCVHFSSLINGQTGGTAGIYLNPRFVILVAAGQEIQSGPSVEQVFAGYNFNKQLPGMLPLNTQPAGYGTPAPQMQAGYGTPAPQMQAGYGAPTQAQAGGYGAPTQAQAGGYGAPTQAQAGGYGAPAPQMQAGYGQTANPGYAPVAAQTSAAPAQPATFASAGIAFPGSGQ